MSRLFEVALCPFVEVRDFVVQNHYSHSAARAGIISHSFSARVEGLLVGAALFGHTAGNAETGAVLLPPYNDSEYNRELLKLVMIDAMPKNSESQFIGICRRYLQGYSTILGLLSYADPEQGHSGIVYRGDNWLYTGMQESASRKLIIDGDECHGKRATEKYGTASGRKLEAFGHTVDIRKAQPKHRYVYLLRRGLEPFMKYKIVPFVGTIVLASLLALNVPNLMHHGGACVNRGLRAIARWVVRGLLIAGLVIGFMMLLADL